MEKTDDEYMTFEVRCPARAWSDGKEDVEKVFQDIVDVLNRHIGDHNLSGSALTFALHRLTTMYIRAMIEILEDGDQKSSVYAMTAQMASAGGDLYEEIRSKMPGNLLRLLEEPMGGAA